MQKDFEVHKKYATFVQNILSKYFSMIELSPSDWTDYELIDSGGFEKLERFGRYTLRRPEPQAVWPKTLSDKDWERLPNAWFKRAKGKETSDNERGEWLQKPSMPDQWYVEYQYKQMRLKFRLGMTSFKHVGLFPEQASNWNFIYDKVKSLLFRNHGLKVLTFEKE